MNLQSRVWFTGEQKFYGGELRRVKGHYFWPRRTLQLRKAYKSIKNIGHKERRVVNDILHKMSRAIVNETLMKNSMVVLGDLKGIGETGFSLHREIVSKYLSLVVLCCMEFRELSDIEWEIISSFP